MPKDAGTSETAKLCLHVGKVWGKYAKQNQLYLGALLLLL